MILSWLINCTFICFFISSIFALDVAIAEIADPGNVIFAVEPILYTISGFPAFAHSERISRI